MKLTATLTAIAIVATTSASFAGGFGGIGVLSGNGVGVKTGHVTVAPQVNALNGGILNGNSIGNGNAIANGSLNGSLNGILSGNNTGVGLGILSKGDSRKKRRKHRW